MQGTLPFVLCPDIPFFQQEPCQKEHRPQPEDAAEGKQPVAARQNIRAFVGVHTQLHKKVDYHKILMKL